MPSAAASFATEMAMAHVPVLTDELLDLLDVRARSRVVDCTFGGGGHAGAVAGLLGPEGVLVACDQDPVAEEYYLDIRPTLACRSRFFLGNFADTLADLGEKGFAATHIYMDLGLSSMQIDTPERGFSYSYDAPLDMRMDPSLSLTAADIVNTWPEKALTGLFGRYGEERFSGRIARAITMRRASTPLHPHGRIGRHDQGSHSHARPFRRRQPGPSGVPGAPHRGQRRTRQPAERAAAGLLAARTGRGTGRDQLPFARRSHSQGVLRRQSPVVHLPTGLPRLRVRSQGVRRDHDLQAGHPRPA